MPEKKKAKLTFKNNKLLAVVGYVAVISMSLFK
jgi:hypothetical protein